VVADQWWVRGRSVVGTDVAGAVREDDDLGPNDGRQPPEEPTMFQISTAHVDHHQSELRADARRWKLRRTVRQANDGQRARRK
jgi:hypothetical protein